MIQSALIIIDPTSFFIMWNKLIGINVVFKMTIYRSKIHLLIYFILSQGSEIIFSVFINEFGIIDKSENKVFLINAKIIKK